MNFNVIVVLNRNSGVIGGKFLECTKVAKPGSSKDNPVYYTAADLLHGATIEVFKHKFVITDADEYVCKYMEVKPEEFSKEAIESWKNQRKSTN